MKRLLRWLTEDSPKKMRLAVDVVNEEKPKLEFIPRPYQAEIAETAMEKNTIIFLPTGSGKTYIAVLVMKKFLSLENRSFFQGGKRCFFVVNTVVLVDQQAAVLERHLPITKAGRYYGAMNVDNWSREKWLSEFEEHEALVMTAEIFRMILAHGFIKPKQLSVVVFDECHRAVGDSPMHEASRLIMQSETEKPRLIGLTATLLNANAKSLEEVIAIVGDLLKSFDAELGCISHEGVQCFSTKPKEEIISYNVVDRSNAAIQSALATVERAMKLTSIFGINRKFRENSILKDKFKKLRKDVKNLLADVTVQFENLGVYGACKAALLAIKLFEYMKVGESNILAILQLTHAINAVTAMCGLLEDRMRPYQGDKRAYYCSSPKVQTLLELLEKIKTEYNGDICCLILVERKNTARLLCTVLKHLAKIPKFSYIKPAFLVGNSGSPDPFPNETADFEKMNRKAIKCFEDKEVNILVSTEVTEEGIDIPQCNCVIKFDKIVSYRSYMQSKGRARSSESHYYILEKSHDCFETRNKLKQFGAIQDYLCSIVRAPDFDLLTSGRDDDEPLEFYKTKTATLRDLDAISILIKYCSLLKYDQYSVELPDYKIRPVGRNGGVRTQLEAANNLGSFVAELRLPRASPFHATIRSDPKPNSKLAKRNAAFKMCVELYKRGELDEDLVPVPPGSNFTPDPSWWPHWTITEELDVKSKKKGDRLGTKNRSCLYFSKIPDCLTDCAPKGNQKAYLHLLCMKPMDHTLRNSFYAPINKELEKSASYALLTTKTMPKVCSFPAYMKTADLVVDFIPNYKQITLTAEDVAKIEFFNEILFVRMVPCVSQSEYEKQLGGKDYLVVPTKTECGGVSIDFKAVEDCVDILDNRKPSDESRYTLQVSDETYVGTVIKPWYRGCEDKAYLVAEVCKDMNGYSRFPGQTVSFAERFEEHYEASSLRPDLPLLRVLPFRISVNGLVKRHDDCLTRVKARNEELYMPDLVIMSPLSGTLWLKATILPTVLFRLERLLISEEVRSMISLQAALGYTNPPSDFVWQPLDAPVGYCDSVSAVNGVESVSVEYKTENISVERDLMSEFWNLDEAQDTSFLETYHDVLKFFPDFSSVMHFTYENVPDVWVPFPRLLRSKGNREGPQLNKIVAALTAPSANDIVNYERMETLGDAFLKVSVSLFLYEACPVRTEGMLSNLKGRFIGNRNLLYCALNKKLPELMSVRSLSLPEDWCVPNFSLPPRKLVPVKKNSLTTHDVDDLVVSFANVSLGNKPRFVSVQDTNTEKDYSNGTQNISDKTAADCVEALLGATLLDCGWDGALNVLVWFDIVPAKVEVRDGTVVPLQVLLQKGFYEPPPATKLIVSKEIRYIQEVINYKFNNMNLLRQALTHPSYDAQNSYERLEFIDFLITSYIYENCGLLTPGQLTDLRSALVNNVTFAALTARYGFNRFMLMNSPNLLQAVDAFINFQKASNYKVDSDVLVLCDDGEVKISDTITVPKALADIFEALAGAIFFDSGRDLCAVWKVFYPIMHPVIESFCKDVPIDPVRRLYETYRCPYFEYNTDDQNKKMIATCTVVLKEGTFKFHGYGDNKKMAKKAVAKFTLHSLKNVKPSSTNSC